MNGSGRVSLRIGAVCAAAIGGVVVVAGMAQTSRTLMEFHGVAPGESSTDSLRAGEWKQLVSKTTAADGTHCLEFQIAPWKKVVVVAKDDRVVGIDLFAPRGLTSQKVCEAFGLGRLIPAAQLPPEARFASAGIAGQLLESQAAFVLLEMEDQGGLQRVRRLRFFGNRPPAARRGAKTGRPAPAIRPDPSGRPAAAVAPFNAQQAERHQQAWAEYLGQPVELTNSIGMKLRLIPPGEFMMGSPESEKWRFRTEDLPHRVRITKQFYLGMHEVTQVEYERVMGTNPSYFFRGGDGSDRVSGLDTRRFPVDRVSWNDAVEFCRKLSAIPAERSAGREYRLPTEAEWEYACRAGTTTPFHFGSVLNGRRANHDGNRPYGTSERGPDLDRPATVGSYIANGFGLYDMHGNVMEWCAKDPGSASGSLHVSRGGCFGSAAGGCRAAHRNYNAPEQRFGGMGLRVVLDPAVIPAE